MRRCGGNAHTVSRQRQHRPSPRSPRTMEQRQRERSMRTRRLHSRHAVERRQSQQLHPHRPQTRQSPRESQRQNTHPQTRRRRKHHSGTINSVHSIMNQAVAETGQDYQIFLIYLRQSLMSGHCMITVTPCGRLLNAIKLLTQSNYLKSNYHVRTGRNKTL